MRFLPRRGGTAANLDQTCHWRPAGKLVLSSDRPRIKGHSVIPAPYTTSGAQHAQTYCQLFQGFTAHAACGGGGLKNACGQFGVQTILYEGSQLIFRGPLVRPLDCKYNRGIMAEP